MKATIVLLALFVVSFAAATPSGEEIETTVLVEFSTVLIQSRGGNVMEALFPINSYLIGNATLTYDQKLYLLAEAGINSELAESIINQVLPVLRSDGKNPQEMLLSLLLLSKELCRVSGSTNIRECEGNSEKLLPLVRWRSEQGCEQEHWTTEGNWSAGEICVCDDQSNALFWINLIEQLTYKSFHQNASRPDQFPLAISMILNHMKCSGHLKIDGSPCSCSAITKGTEPMYMQYLITSEEVQSLLTPEQRLAIRTMFAIPEQRIFGSTNNNVEDLLISTIGQSLDPTLLSLLLNRDSTSNEQLRQLVLSSVGLDSSLLQVILNGGFGDNSEQVNFISYLTQLGVLDSSIIPLLFGVNNGQNFFIQSLIEGGRIDPTMALLLLGQTSGLSQNQLLEVLVEGLARAPNNPDYFTSLGRPYIPPLPEGIYPGSQLFFAHFETLGVNTCSLHDLRNRFECGYIGITASACEVIPYCCYSPVFITDEEVQRATGNSINAASQVPWCYYNIFFIYYDSFYLPVVRPGEFAAPVQCRGVYKYGINLDPNLATLTSGSTSNSLQSLIIPRDECGFPGITEFQCVAVRACCFDPNSPFRVPQCYRPNGPANIAFNYNNIPTAYKPTNGSCNVNPFQIPILYFQRVACLYTLEFHKIGYNVLSYPSRLDCLTKLGCCWEDDETVIERYPFTPQCYKRVGGASRPANVPLLSSLVLRSGSEQMPEIFDHFPPATPPPQ